MGRFANAALRKPKQSRSKKTTRGEKRKLDTKGRSPTPEPEYGHDARLPEPEVAKTPKKSKKDVSKETEIVIREPVPEARRTYHGNIIKPSGESLTKVIARE